MSNLAKQDRNGVRTAQGLEQKYNLGTVKKEIITVKENTEKQKFDFDKKVDKEPGKGLSTNDFTDKYKEKLEDISGIPPGGTKNQVLCKNTDKDGDVVWKDEKGESITEFINVIYPVGALFFSTNSTSPELFFEGTQWKQIKDTFLLACGDKYKNSTIGGNSEITLKEENIPKHEHSIPKLTGSTNLAGSHTHTGRYARYGNSGSNLVLRRISNEDDYRGEDIVTNSSGNHKHTVTTEESSTGSVGEGKPFSIMPRYFTIFVWERIK